MNAAFFAGNRQRLIAQLPPDSFVAMAGFGSVQRDVDQPFAFSQEGNFWYLTGVEEPDWQLIINVSTGDEWLVAPTLNQYQQIFNGGLAAENAAARSGVKKVISRAEAKAIFTKMAGKQVFTVVPKTSRVYGFQPNAGPRKLVRQLRDSKINDLTLTLAKMRAIKQPAEIEAIQTAVDITVDGLLALLPKLKTYSYEYQADAQLYAEFRSRGATHGFDPIIASGAKTCVLHSPASNDPLGDVVLLDVGARLNGYTADITRTVPVKPPTERWLQVYEAVERMHDYFFTLLKPGAAIKDVLAGQAYPYIGELMVELGLIKKPLADRNHIFKYMPHAITHGLGVDTHDPLGRPETFAENMVLTDEVGIYIPEEGIGIRLESDVLITKTGARNLCAKLPTSLDAITKVVY